MKDLSSNGSRAPENIEQIYRTLYENLPDGIVGFDKNGRITLCNDRVLEMFGYSLEEVIGETFDVFLPPELKKTAWKAFVEGIERGHSLYIGIETIGLRKDGTTFHFHINSTVVYENEEVTGYFSLVRDIDDRMNTLEALRMSEQRFREMISSVPEGIATTDLNEKLMFVNDGFAKLVGYEVGELIGKSILDLIPSEERNTISEGTVGRRMGIASSYNLTLIRRDGQKRNTRVSAAPWVDAAGTIIGTLAVVVDITEQIQLEQDLSEMKARYLLITEHSKDLIATMDMNLHFTYVSPSVRDVLGYEIDELLHKSAVDILTPESLELMGSSLLESLELEETVGKDGYEAPPLEFEIYHKNGFTIWAEVSRVFLRDENDTPIGILGVVRDITKRKIAENNVRTSLRELELYSSLLRHDIGNDLQIASGAIEGARLTAGDISKVEKYIAMAQASIERMVGLVTLADTRSTGPVEKLGDLVKQRIRQAESVHSGLKIKLRAKGPARDASLASGRLLPLFLDNMFRNTSIHAGPKSKIIIDLQKVGNNIQIDIVDDGPGIAAEIRSSIFQRRVSTKNGGMGLYLCKRIIEGYGGTLEMLESSPLGKGAAFRARLPLRDPADMTP